MRDSVNMLCSKSFVQNIVLCLSLHIICPSCVWKYLCLCQSASVLPILLQESCPDWIKKYCTSVFNDLCSSLCSRVTLGLFTCVLICDMHFTCVDDTSQFYSTSCDLTLHGLHSTLKGMDTLHFPYIDFSSIKAVSFYVYLLYRSEKEIWPCSWIDESRAVAHESFLPQRPLVENLLRPQMALHDKCYIGPQMSAVCDLLQHIRTAASNTSPSKQVLFNSIL